MTPGMDTDTLVAHATRLVQHYAWHYVTLTRLLPPVRQRWATELVVPGAEPQLCLQEASALLYAACGPAGPALPSEEAPYHDVRAYLLRIASHLHLPSAVTADDVVQATLLTLWRTGPTCTDPRAFLAWAATLLRREAVTSGRRIPRPEQAARSLEAPGVEAQAQPLERVRRVDPLGDQELLRLLHACLDTDEERWYAAGILLGLKRRELHLLLDADPAHLDVVAARVRRKLRAHPAFQAWAEP